MHKINLQDKFDLIQDFWNPRIVGELNHQYVKLVKFHGEFTWHHHDEEDELFLVVAGKLLMRYRDQGIDQEIPLEAGEFIIVPKGVDHQPVAVEDCQVLLFEPQTTLNTGNVIDKFTRQHLEHI